MQLSEKIKKDFSILFEQIYFMLDTGISINKGIKILISKNLKV